MFNSEFEKEIAVAGLFAYILAVRNNEFETMEAASRHAKIFIDSLGISDEMLYEFIENSITIIKLMKIMEVNQ